MDSSASCSPITLSLDLSPTMMMPPLRIINPTVISCHPREIFHPSLYMQGDLSAMGAWGRPCYSGVVGRGGGWTEGKLRARGRSRAGRHADVLVGSGGGLPLASAECHPHRGLHSSSASPSSGASRAGPATPR